MPPLTNKDVVTRELVARNVHYHNLRGHTGYVFAVTQYKQGLIKEGRGLEANLIDKMVRCAKGFGPMPPVDYRDRELRTVAAIRDNSKVIVVRGLASFKRCDVAIYKLRSGRKVCVRAAARRLRRAGLDEQAAYVEAVGKAVLCGEVLSKSLLLKYGPLFAAPSHPLSVC